MTRKHSKLRNQSREEQNANLQQSSEARAEHAFESVEQALQQDASGTTVPPAIEERLSRSVASQPRQPRSWWKRWRNT